MDNPKTETAQPLGGLTKIEGETGTYVMGGFITFEEYNPKLIDRRGIKEFDIMRKSDPTIHAMLTAVKLPLRSAHWLIKPAGEDPLDVEAADFITQELMNRNVNWNQFMSEMLTMFDFGFSLFEKTYEKTDFNGQTRIGIKELGPRKARSILRWEQANGKPGVTQVLQKGTATIDEDKLLLFTNDREGDNYQGVSVLRYAYKPWHMKHNLETITAMGIERMAVGVPVLMPPENPDTGDVESARAFLRQFRANSQQYMELPHGWNVEMMDMKANTTKDALPFINYLSVNIMKAVLAQFLELSSSSSSTGSRALSEDHSQFFEKAEEAAADIICATINEKLIQQLCDLNWLKLPSGYPKITFSNLGDEELTVMGQFITAATGGGVLTPDPDLEDHLRSIARLPALPEDLKDPEAYANRETVQTAIQNTQLGMMTDPAMGGNAKPVTANKSNPGQTKTGAKGGKQTKPAAGNNAKASLEELRAYRQDLIARVMADAS